MLQRLAIILLMVLCLITSCASATSGLKTYIDSTDGYQFLYPRGWLPVKAANGADVVFHDFIEISENISVVVSPVPEGKVLSDLGTPGEVGYKLGKNALAPPESGRIAELVNAEAREKNAKNYYFLEYVIKLPNQQQRHNLASVAVSKGKLFTFNASVPEKRWAKVQQVLNQVVDSFSIY